MAAPPVAVARGAHLARVEQDLGNYLITAPGELRERPQPGRFYVISDGVLAVLSLPAVSVWSDGRVLWWQDGDGGITWPAADAPGAVQRLGELMAAPEEP